MFAYEVRRVTHDKLERSMNAYAAEGWRITPHFTGGRDWTIVAEREVSE